MSGSDSRRWWALVAIAASVLVVGLDLTVLNLALPTLSRDLHASTGDLQWFSDAYSLVLAAAVLPAGLLGDRIGRRSDPRPGRAGAGRRRDPAALAVDPARAVHRRRAAQGDRHHGLRHVHQLPGRTAARRLAAG